MSFGIGTRSVRTANTYPKASRQQLEQPLGVRSANTRDQPKAGATDPDLFGAGATTGAPVGAI
jgi:hypothetical protein